MTPDDQPRRILHRRARAKLNLALAVGPPRDADDEFDGYHPIASWMATIGLADELILTRLSEGSLSRYAIGWHPEAVRTSPIDWSIRDDLAVRAHLALQETVGRELPVQLKLDKRIPVGGGLGGGSSDAASMLLALRDMFALDVDVERLASIALELGSDVPFFVRVGAGASVVERVGDVITPVDAPSGWAVLAMPGFGCPTGAVYRAFDEDMPDSFRDGDVRAMAEAGDPHGAELFNDLGEPSVRVEPRLGELRARLNGACGSVFHVTGSGSTLFAITTDEARARDLAAKARAVEQETVCLAVPFESG